MLVQVLTLKQQVLTSAILFDSLWPTMRLLRIGEYVNPDKYLDLRCCRGFFMSVLGINSLVQPNVSDDLPASCGFFLSARLSFLVPLSQNRQS